eukprot:1882587-Amphidinium_carterae.7
MLCSRSPPPRWNACFSLGAYRLVISLQSLRSWGELSDSVPPVIGLGPNGWQANMVQLPQQGALFGTGQQMGAPGYAPQGGFQPAYPGY